MSRRTLPICIFVLAIALCTTAPAEIVLTPGDIGASDPDAMPHTRRGLLMPRNEAFVFSHAVIPYPAELAGASTVTVSLYFLTQSGSSADVRMRCWLASYDTGDPFNASGFTLDAPAVAVGGTTTDVYKQVFNFTTVPAPRELFSLAVSRHIYGGDTYADPIYLHASKLEIDSVVAVDDVATATASSLALRVEPNPFNPATSIAFDLPAAGPVTVNVLDVKGRHIATLLENEWLDAGSQSVPWAPDRLASGTYLVRVESAGLMESLKVALVR